RAFRATGLPYAEDSLRSVMQTLDRYAADLSESRKDSCQATRIRGQQSDAIFTLRTQCFDRRLGELRGLSDVLSHADGSVVEHAVAAAARLTPVAACNDAAALLGDVRPADDPEVRKQVEALRSEIDRGWALEATGKFAEALPSAQAYVERGRALRYR